MQNPDLEKHGLKVKTIHWNPTPAEVYEYAVRRSEVTLAWDGQMRVDTTPHTGRSPKDKFLVDEPSTSKEVWWGKVNQPFDEAKFEALYRKVIDYQNSQEELFVRDLYACADPKYRLPVRFISPASWYMLFVNNLFIRPPSEDLEGFVPEFTVLHTPELQAEPDEDGTNSGAFIILNFAKKLILIGGTRYGGELKKSLFTVLNYLLPKKGVLSMHCSANLGEDGNTALFFGLSGTGKTTLSADPSRALIGDDEHGWSDDGVFNLEGGCYAKVIKLSAEAEPDIYAAAHRFGSVLENVVMKPDRRLDLDSQEITENTRAAYPINFNSNTVPSGMGGHPNHIILLTADAWGILPPIAKLNPDQAMYYFLSGYTAKLAGTERGVTTPQATFSACFGDVFLVMHPTVYAEMLAEKMKKHNATAWLVNTGWTGGPYGEGHRMEIAHTRAMVRAAINGELQDVEMETDPVLGVSLPTSIPGVPAEVLRPRQTWANKEAYDQSALQLAARFHENFEKFADKASPKVLAAGPLIGKDLELQ